MRPGPPPPSHLHVVHGAPVQAPRSIMARGLMYWLASLVGLANASVSLALAIRSAVAAGAAYGAHLHALAAKMPLWGAAIALVCFHSPAALTLLTPTLAFVQVCDLILGVRQGAPLHIGVALFFSVSTAAASIPLVAEQALKRQRWLRTLRARGQLHRP